ncbi:hypothetical protein DFQ28_005105, partial [Apophysomyces sp. BC1034]
MTVTTTAPQSTTVMHSTHPNAVPPTVAVGAGAGGGAAGQGGNGGGLMTAGPSQDTAMCESCRKLRHISYFHVERELKCNVCDYCRSHEIQKRKCIEGMEVYEGPQRTFKQARFSPYQPQSTQPQLHHLSPHSIQAQLHTPTPLGLPHQSPQQMSHPPLAKPSPPPPQPPPSLPPTSMMSAMPQQQTSKPSHLFAASPMRTQSQLQSHGHPQMMQPSMSLPLPLPPQEQIPQHQSLISHPSATPSPLPHEAKQISPLQTQQQRRPTEKTMPVMLPAAMAAASNGANRSTPSPSISSNDKSNQDIISLDTFVGALQQETEFERKQYTVDITPLIINMGDNAGFTQLGRAICERILIGTKFNF